MRGAIAGLEAKKAALMHSVALANRAEVERVCAATRMPLPPPPAGLAGDGTCPYAESGQVSKTAGPVQSLAR